MSTSPPKPRTTRAMRSSSVATSTRETADERRTRSYTCSIMGRPWMSERGFPGRRMDAKRAGMMATMAKIGWGPRVSEDGIGRRLWRQPSARARSHLTGPSAARTLGGGLDQHDHGGRDESAIARRPRGPGPATVAILGVGIGLLTIVSHRAVVDRFYGGLVIPQGSGMTAPLLEE